MLLSFENWWSRCVLYLTLLTSLMVFILLSDLIILIWSLLLIILAVRLLASQLQTQSFLSQLAELFKRLLLPESPLTDTLEIVDVFVWLFIKLYQIVLGLEPAHVEEWLPDPTTLTFFLVLVWDFTIENWQVEGVDRVTIANVIDAWGFSSVDLVSLRIGGYCCRSACFNQDHIIAVFSL